MVFLVMSLMIILPLNFGSVYGVTNEEVDNTCGLLGSVQDSFILSVVTLCLPGILNKMQQWKQMGCEKAVCKYNAIKANLDPTFCEKQYDYKYCKLIWGELFSIPPMSIIEVVKDMIKELIANPVGLAFAGGVALIRHMMDISCGTGKLPSCTSTNVLMTGQVVLFIVDAAAAVQTISDMMENGFFPDDSGTDYCEEAEDIKSELEKVVKAYKNLQGVSE